MTRGRPLRFLAAVLAGWTGARVVWLWPAVVPQPLAVAPARASPLQLAERRGALVVIDVPPPTPIRRATEAPPRPTEPPPALQAHAIVSSGPRAAITVQPDSPAQEGPVGPPASPIAQLSADRPDRPSRLAGDVWLVLRPGAGENLAFGQLGGSQGGARVTYGLDPARRLALSARVSAPVQGRGAEAALGIDLKPIRAPVHLLVEQRIGLDGGGTRPAAGVIAGASTALPARLRLDAYGQAGAVWKRGGFADGAALLIRPVHDHGRTRLELGAGAWGAAQRRASRLDVGPSAALVLPTGGATLRLQLDYRARIAGNARPGSGPALSLGGSF